MRLWKKFSLLLCGCVLIYFFFTTLVLSRFFASEQRVYLRDFQTTLGVYHKQQLEARMESVFTEVETALQRGSFNLGSLLSSLPHALVGQVWSKGKLVRSFPSLDQAPDPPVAGTSTWTLVPSPLGSDIRAVRWLGRYGEVVVTIDFQREWLEDILEASHGVTSELILEDGKVLLRSEGHSLASTSPVSDSAETLNRLLTKQNSGAAQTVQYEATDKASYLGTFLRVESDPKIIILLRTPISTIEGVVRRTYANSSWIAAFSIALALAIGLIFSTSLTAPLQALAKQTAEIAQGKNEIHIDTGADRSDEVGILARAFNEMVTRLNIMREELKRSEQLAAMGKFSASIAHEIKNPLANIIANAQTIQMKLNENKTEAISSNPFLAATPAPTEVEPDGADQALKYVIDEAWRASRTISRLMKFARMDKAPTTTIDFCETVRHSLDLNRANIKKSEITLAENLEPKPVMCLGDEDQLHEVITNIVQNGMYALKKVAERKLTISLACEGNFAVLRIQDNGTGIPEEAKKRLFEPFFTTKPIGEGTGLGLAVCHGIVSTHKGTIQVDSTVGQGTTFIIRIPLAEASAALSQAA